MNQLADRLENVAPFLAVEFLGNTVVLWGIALLAAVVAWLALMVVRGRLASRLERLAERTSTRTDDLVVHLLRKTSGLFLAIVAVWVGLQVLDLATQVATVARSILIVSAIIQAGLWGNRAVGLWLSWRSEALAESDPGAMTTLHGLSYVVRLIVWSAVLLLVLDNLGVDVTALVAGLGVGGIAVALAVQNVLGDLFASLSIVLDKPFVIGDFVIVGEHLGTVEKIGLKTTRVRSLSGEQIIFSNSDLLSSRVRNYKRMDERRVAFQVGVIYQTPVAQLEAIPELAREIIESQERVRFDRAHFKGFGDSAYLFEFVYYVLSPDYTEYMDVQQAINLGLCRAFEEREIEFAYPTRTIHMAG